MGPSPTGILFLELDASNRKTRPFGLVLVPILRGYCIQIAITFSRRLLSVSQLPKNGSLEEVRAQDKRTKASHLRTSRVILWNLTATRSLRQSPEERVSRTLESYC